jgi:hypothetical protein
VTGPAFDTDEQRRPAADSDTGAGRASADGLDYLPDNGCTFKATQRGREVVIRIPSCLACPAVSGCRYESGEAGRRAREELVLWAWRVHGAAGRFEHINVLLAGDRAAIRTAHLAGEKVPAIAARYRVSTRTIHRVLAAARKPLAGTAAPADSGANDPKGPLGLQNPSLPGENMRIAASA